MLILPTERTNTIKSKREVQQGDHKTFAQMFRSLEWGEKASIPRLWSGISSSPRSWPCIGNFNLGLDRPITQVSLIYLAGFVGR